MNIIKDLRTWGCVAVMTVLCGCNVGMAPTGGSPAQIEDNFKKEDPQQQIRTIQMSPAPPEKKAQLIKDIETKYGIKAGDTSAPGQTPPEHH